MESTTRTVTSSGCGHPSLSPVLSEVELDVLTIDEEAPAGLRQRSDNPAHRDLLIVDCVRETYGQVVAFPVQK